MPTEEVCLLLVRRTDSRSESGQTNKVRLPEGQELAKSVRSQSNVVLSYWLHDRLPDHGYADFEAIQDHNKRGRIDPAPVACLVRYLYL